MEKQMMESIAQERLKVISQIKFITIQSMYYVQKKDEHTTVEIEGTIDYSSFPEDIGRQMGQIYIYDVQEQEELLFVGLIQEINLKCTGGFYLLKVSCADYTILLEQNRISGSYQDRESSYLSILQEVINKNGGGRVSSKLEDRKLYTPIIRYQETDWEFVKRLGAYLGASIAAVPTVDRPKISIDFPKGRMREQVKVEKVIYKITPQKGIRYEVTSKENWNIGDRIFLHGYTFFAAEKKGIFEKGSLSYVYLLAEEKYMGKMPYGNEYLRGISLRGQVIDVRQEEVKIHLNIDKRQEKEKAWWFPYLPETGNLMYCMPETGDRVNLYLGCGKEENAIVTNCFRDGNSPQEGAYLITPCEKRLLFDEKQIGFIANSEEKQKMVLLQEEKIVLQDRHQIRIQAQNRVYMEASHLQVTAPKEVTILKSDLFNPSVINLNHTVDIIGEKSGVQCTKEMGRKYHPLAEEKEYDLGEIKHRIRTSIPFSGKGSNAAELLCRTMLCE